MIRVADDVISLDWPELADATMKLSAGITACPASVAGNSPSLCANADVANSMVATEQSRDRRMVDLLEMKRCGVLRGACYSRLTVL